MYSIMDWIKDCYGIATIHDNLIMQWTYDGSQIIYAIIADYIKKELLYVTNEDLSSLQHHAIIDLNDEGERWEGNVLNNKPIGWGCYYNKDNNKIYEGFMVDMHYVCCGTKYYADLHVIDYCGMYYNHKRFGKGCQYDRLNHIIYDGEWIDNKHMEPKLMVTDLSTPLSNHIKALTIADNMFNKSIDIVDFGYFEALKELKIGNDCFKSVNKVLFNKMQFLEKIEIGEKAFTKWLYWYTTPNNRDAHFICTNNPQLTSLTIGCYSFSDFRECQLENLPVLKSITMGNYMYPSYNFYNADFKLAYLSQLQTLILGEFCFYNSVHTIVKNLPSLKQIQLGKGAIQGDGEEDSACSLTMQNLPSLTFINSIADSFYFPHTVILENIPIVEYVNLPYAFEEIKHYTIQNVATCFINLIPNISSEKDLQSLSQSTDHINITEDVFTTAISLNLSPYMNLKLLIIHSDNYKNVDFNISNLPQLQTIVLGCNCFQYSVHTVIKNLPNLKQIQLGGWYSLGGKEDDDKCSLIMQNLPSLTELTSKGLSFRYVRSIILENIPNLNHVDLPWSFGNIHTHSIQNVATCLTNLIPNISSEKDLQSLSHSIDYINFTEGLFKTATSLDLSPYMNIKRLIIHDTSFKKADFSISNLPQLQTLILGDNCFNSSFTTIIKNLPNLKQIKLGICALTGIQDDDDCTLIMQNLPSLTHISSKWGSFYYSHSVFLENIPNLTHVELPNAFDHVQHRTIHSDNNIMYLKIDVAECLANLVQIWVY